MNLVPGMKVRHKYRDQLAIVETWDDIGINPHYVQGILFYEMFIGNFESYD